MKCGRCWGQGEVKQYDGVGGAWYERCGQCNGHRTVAVLIEKWTQMKIYVVKYDDTQPYDPGTCLIIGAYSTRDKALDGIEAAKAETKLQRCVDYEAMNKAGIVRKTNFNDYLYTEKPVPKYGQDDSYYEIVETELDDA